MAEQGTLITPYIQGALELIAQLKLGNLITPWTSPVPDRITAQYGNRFPVPPVSFAFLVDVNPVIVDRASIISGAVFPESSYLEPTIGQIWPR